jgi:hypothetical protein
MEMGAERSIPCTIIALLKFYNHILYLHNHIALYFAICDILKGFQKVCLLTEFIKICDYLNMIFEN